MKASLLTAVYCTVACAIIAQPIDRTFENARGTVNLLGLSTTDRLTQPPFDVWYQENYESYEVNTEVLGDLALPDSITLFMGTWCGDSKREVPRFIKVLEYKGYDFSKLKIINLNTGFQNYKQAPEREEQGLFIHRVPTFILHDDTGEEIGRIVQDPVLSLEEDLRTLMAGEPYATAFPVAEELIALFQTQSTKDIRSMLPELVPTYQEKSTGERELSTFGYVMWTSFDLARADVLFELNTLLYPESVRAHLLLINFKNSYGRPEEAMVVLDKALKLAPDNAQLLEWQQILEEELAD